MVNKLVHIGESGNKSLSFTLHQIPTKTYFFIFLLMNYRTVKFSARDTSDFSRTLKTRVREYFKNNGISKYANGRMITKTVFMVGLYFVPYILMMTGVITNTWLILGAYITMGMGMAGIGLSVMHDANHGAYSRNKYVNKFLGLLLDVLGGSAHNWKIQHNQLHHTFTNVDGLDDDISSTSLMRFSPHQKRKKMHRAQHFYAWFLYGLMTLSWVLAKDFKVLRWYKDRGLLNNQKKSYKRLVLEIALSKVAYFSYMIVLPIIILPISWWQCILFFLLLHFIAGLTLAAIFQPAHVIPETDFPLPDDNGNMENNWNIHQLHTTANFAPKSILFSWFVGGLNYQIEHHLFPNICHVHYKNISHIVKQTAEEFGLPYHSQPTFAHALWKHTKLLKTLGSSDNWKFQTA